MSYKSAIHKSLLGLLVAAALLIAFSAATPYTVNGPFVRDLLFTRMANWTGGTVIARGPAYLKSLFSLTVEAQDVEISAPEMSSLIEKVHASKLTGRISWWDLLQGRLAFEKVWLFDPKIQLAETPDRPMGGGDLASLFRRGVKEIERSPFPEFVIYGGTLVPADNSEWMRDLGEFTGRFELLDGGSVLLTQGQFNWRGQEVSFFIRRGSFDGRGAIRKAPYRLSLTGPFGEIEADGEATFGDSPRFDGVFDVSLGDIRTTAEWLRVDLPIPGEAESLTAKGAFVWKGNTVAIDELNLSWGGLSAKGVITVDYNNVRPRIGGTLDLGSVSMMPYLQPPSAQPAQAEIKSADGRASGAPHAVTKDEQDFQPLERLLNLADADLRLSAASISAGPIWTGPAALFISVKSGKLKGDLAELMIFGGSVRGQFDLSKEDEELWFSIKGLARGVRLGDVFATASLSPWVSGEADVTFHAAGRGRTLREIGDSTTLVGHLLALDSGQIGLDVLGLLANARAHAAGDLKTRSLFAAGSAPGEFDTLSARFSLNRERLEVTEFGMTKREWAVFGKGLTNIAKRTMDWRFYFKQYPREEDARAGSVTGAVAGEPGESLMTLLLGGSWGNPQLRFIPPHPASRAAHKVEGAASR